MRYRRGWVFLAGTGLLLVLCSGTALASEGEAANPVLEWSGKIFNFAVLAGGLFFLLRKPVAALIENRSAGIRHKLEEAEHARARAEARLQEIEVRLGTVQQEVDALLAKAQRDSEAEEARILERAREEAARLQAKTAAEMESLKKQALGELGRFAAERAAAAAEEILRREIRPADEEHFREQFLARLGGMR